MRTMLNNQRAFRIKTDRDNQCRERIDTRPALFLCEISTLATGTMIKLALIAALFSAYLCKADDAVLQSFSLKTGKAVFWDGEYIEQAAAPNILGLSNPVAPTLAAELEAMPLGTHHDYELNLLEQGARLRVAFDVVFVGFRGWPD